MSRRRVFWLVAGVTFVFSSVVFWRGTELALFGLLAAELEGNRDGGAAFIGWLLGNAIPALLLGCIGSVVVGVVRKRRSVNVQAATPSSEHNRAA
jgi:hypothetical protein